MQWTMPHRVLQIVAALIGLAALASFATGIITAPQRGGRLPGEKAAGAGGPAEAIDAADATPLNNERIEGPPPPTPEEIAAAKAKEEEAARRKAEEAAARAAEQETIDSILAGNAAAPPRLSVPPGNTSPAPATPPRAEEPPF